MERRGGCGQRLPPIGIGLGAGGAGQRRDHVVERARRQHGLDTMADGLTGGVTSTVNMLLDPTIPGHLPPEVTGRLGAAIAAVRSELPPGALDDVIAPRRPRDPGMRGRA